jgi:Chaperone of endosialidase
LNTAIGAGALLFNAGDNNTATGALALLSNTGGFYSTADGAFALFLATPLAAATRELDTRRSSATRPVPTMPPMALPRCITTPRALTPPSVPRRSSITRLASTTRPPVIRRFIPTGNKSAAFGQEALHDATSSFNVAVGALAGANIPTGGNNIDIGNQGFFSDSGTIRIGGTLQTATDIAGIAGQTVGAGGTTCYVDNEGKLGVFLSARRFKTHIADMNSASETLLRLRPVTFRYKPDMKATNAPQLGLIAEEVAEVNPDLVTHDASRKLSTLRYEAVNAMLLNEFLKEHRKVREQGATIRRLEKQLDALTAALQKVSAQLELNQPAPQTVWNTQ